VSKVRDSGGCEAESNAATMTLQNKGPQYFQKAIVT